MYGQLINILTLLYVQDKPRQLKTRQLSFGKSYNVWTAHKYLDTFVYIGYSNATEDLSVKFWKKL